MYVQDAKASNERTRYGIACQCRLKSKLRTYIMHQNPTSNAALLEAAKFAEAAFVEIAACTSRCRDSRGDKPSSACPTTLLTSVGSPSVVCRHMRSQSMPRRRGGATLLRVGVQYYCERSEQKIFWVVPAHIPFWGVQQLQREAHGSLSDSIATISYWSCSCNF